MKIEKYNQILLAIGGTIALTFFCVGGLFLIIEEGRYFFRSDDYTPSGILSTEETNQLVQDSLRKQLISFTNMNLLDSATQVYLLPVTQANLLKDEDMNDLLGLINTTSRMKRSKSYYGSGSLFNNFVVYNSIEENSTIVFDKRVSISEYHLYEQNNQKFLVVIAADTDSNKDKYINDDDLQKLFVYEIETGNLQQIIANEAYTVNRVIQNSQTNEVIGQFGLDRNKDGEFSRYREPLIYYKIDVENKRLIETVTSEQIEKLQNLLEGR